MRPLMLCVDSREESREQALKLTLRLDTPDTLGRYHVTLWIDVTADPSIRDLQVGDRLEMTLAPVPVPVEPPPPAPGVPEATDLVEDEVMF